MKNKPYFHIITVGLAIFSMFFGAGNLMFPLNVGLHAGTNNSYGMLGFIMTAVCLPLAGLIAMILFDGDYTAFFQRLGMQIGSAVTFICIIIIGPLIAIPRIVTLSHIMIAPFLPIPLLQSITPLSSFLFALIFLGITFLTTYRENRIVNLLGTVISPLLLISLIIIIGKGLINATIPIAATASAWDTFAINFIRGYETLDLLGGIFFSSIVIHILKETSKTAKQKELALIGLKAGVLGVSLLTLVYIGMSLLSVYYGHSLIMDGTLFRSIAFTILGNHGAFIIGTAVLMACFSTSIALSAVVGDYFHVTIFKQKISHISALLVALLLSIPLSTVGLDKVLALTAGPIIYIGYTSIITLTFCNIAYKLIGFKPVKIPVAITFIVALICYSWM